MRQLDELRNEAVSLPFSVDDCMSQGCRHFVNGRLDRIQHRVVRGAHVAIHPTVENLEDARDGLPTSWAGAQLVACEFVVAMGRGYEGAQVFLRFLRRHPRPGNVEGGCGLPENGQWILEQIAVASKGARDMARSGLRVQDMAKPKEEKVLGRIGLRFRFRDFRDRATSSGLRMGQMTTGRAPNATMASIQNLSSRHSRGSLSTKIRLLPNSSWSAARARSRNGESHPTTEQKAAASSKPQ